MLLSVLLAFALALPSVSPAQNALLTIAPGLAIPDSKTPWALDQYKGLDQLVPIHHSSVDINNHTGANIAGSLAGSFFYKPKTSLELSGLHAHSHLHSSKPVIYLHVEEEDPTPSDSAKGTTYSWTITRASIGKDRRIFAQIRFTQLTGGAKRDNDAIPIKVDHIENGWIRITPEQPLEPSEYAIMPVYKSQKLLPSVVFDFSVDPSSENAEDAISATK